MEMRKILWTALTASLISVTASAEQRLGSCEGSFERDAYLVELRTSRSGIVGQVYRYESHAGGDEWLDVVGSPIRLHDDPSKENGSVTHSLFDADLDYSQIDAAILRIIYTADGNENAAPASIRITDESGQTVELSDGTCTLSAPWLSRQ